MKQRIAIAATILRDDVVAENVRIVVDVEAPTTDAAVERLAHAIEKLTASTARRSRARPSGRSSGTTKPT